MSTTINTIPSNQELFEMATAEGTPGAAIFADYDNFEQFANTVAGLNTEAARQKANEFLNITMAWFDKEMYVEEAVDILEEQGFGTKESMNYAGMMRNLYIKVGDPVDPKFKGLQDGDNFSPYITKKPTVAEYFFTFNSDYQNYITIQPVEIKTAFASAYGVSELEAKVMQGLRNKFVQWAYEKKLEVLNYLVNDNNLKDSQKVEVNMDSYSNAELQNLSNVIDNVVSAMTLTSNGAFNMNNWKERQRKENLRVLMKPIIDNAAKNYITPYAFNDVVLKNGVQKVYVENYGGLQPVYIDTDNNNAEVELTPIYDNEGRVTHTYKDASDNVYTESQITWKDPNEDILAVICDKDIMKMIEQEGYLVESIYNPRTRQTNFWASEANIGFIYDRQKNIVIVKKKLTPEPTEPEIICETTDLTFDTPAGTDIAFEVSNPDSVVFTASAESSDETVATVGEITESEGTYSFSIANVAPGTAGTATITITLTGSDSTVYDTHTISVVVEAAPVEKVFTSEDIANGETYASNYFAAGKAFTITNLEESDTVAMTTDLVSLTLTENEGVYTVAGVNVGETSQAVSITLNGETVCGFTIAGTTPAEENT